MCFHTLEQFDNVEFLFNLLFNDAILYQLLYGLVARIHFLVINLRIMEEVEALGLVPDVLDLLQDLGVDLLRLHFEEELPLPLI